MPISIYKQHLTLGMVFRNSMHVQSVRWKDKKQVIIQMLSKVSNSHLADHLLLAWLSGFSWAFFWKIYEYLFNKEGAVRSRNHNEDNLKSTLFRRRHGTENSTLLSVYRIYMSNWINIVCDKHFNISAEIPNKAYPYLMYPST